jgi:hypothetical protein
VYPSFILPAVTQLRSQLERVLHERFSVTALILTPFFFFGIVQATVKSMLTDKNEGVKIKRLASGDTRARKWAGPT